MSVIECFTAECTTIINCIFEVFNRNICKLRIDIAWVH